MEPLYKDTPELRTQQDTLSHPKYILLLDAFQPLNACKSGTWGGKRCPVLRGVLSSSVSIEGFILLPLLMCFLSTHVCLVCVLLCRGSCLVAATEAAAVQGLKGLGEEEGGRQVTARLREDTSSPLETVVHHIANSQAITVLHRKMTEYSILSRPYFRSIVCCVITDGARVDSGSSRKPLRAVGKS